MKTFEQYLESLFSKKKPIIQQEIPTVEPINRQPQAAKKPVEQDPMMSPYGRYTQKFKYSEPITDIDYFQNKPGLGYRGYLDKSSMSPENKQGYWNKKLDSAINSLKNGISLIGTYIDLKSHNEKVIAKYIIDKVRKLIEKFKVQYGKGGSSATPGTVDTLNTKGWRSDTQATNEAIDQQASQRTFENVKNKIIDCVKKWSNPAVKYDNDITNLINGIKKQIINFVTTMKTPVFNDFNAKTPEQKQQFWQPRMEKIKEQIQTILVNSQIESQRLVGDHQTGNKIVNIIYSKLLQYANTMQYTEKPPIKESTENQSIFDQVKQIFIKRISSNIQIQRNRFADPYTNKMYVQMLEKLLAFANRLHL